MSFIISKLFMTSDGSIPFIQIAVGIILGALGMFLYARFYMYTPQVTRQQQPQQQIQPIQQTQAKKIQVPKLPDITMHSNVRSNQYVIPENNTDDEADEADEDEAEEDEDDDDE